VFLPDLVVRSRRVVTPSGTRSAAIHVRGPRIIGVLDFDDVPEGCPVEDMDPGIILPGIVDTRVHVEPKTTNGEHPFAATTRAAAAGGVTSIVVAPSKESPATSVASLAVQRRLADGHCWVDVGFWGGVVSANAAEIRPLFDGGVLGFECALVPNADLAAVTERDLRTVMPGLRHLGASLLIHADGGDPQDIARSVDLCREYQTATHLVQLSSSSALTPLFHGRAARLPLTAETCPHYLNLISEELPAKAAALRHAPPIRDRENREFLWAALANGLIQLTSADRFTPLELSLAMMWLGANGRKYSIDRVAEWMSFTPARLAGLPRKGRIEVGYDADFAVFDPEAEPAPHEHHRVYGRRQPRGAVERTYLRGQPIYSRADGWAAEPRGNPLIRGTC
jgi:allantoinase